MAEEVQLEEYCLVLVGRNERYLCDPLNISVKPCFFFLIVCLYLIAVQNIVPFCLIYWIFIIARIILAKLLGVWNENIGMCLHLVSLQNMMQFRAYLDIKSLICRFFMTLDVNVAC